MPVSLSCVELSRGIIPALFLVGKAIMILMSKNIARAREDCGFNGKFVILSKFACVYEVIVLIISYQ